METLTKAIAVFLAGLTLTALLALIIGFAIKILANYVLAPSLLMFIFGTPKITFWQAYLFAILISMFKSGSSSSKD